MAQYRKAKAEISDDTLLLFRMGDFYEMFFEDAVTGSRLMDITLTKRSGVAMAGIPYHALENYLTRVLESGVKVAIAEQVEDPKVAKGLVKREITQVITPGTIVEGNVLKSGKSNYLTGLFESAKGVFGIASLDISTGDFRITEVDNRELLEVELNRVHPAECIISESMHRQIMHDGFAGELHHISWTSVDDWTFDSGVCDDLLKRQFGVASLDGFGCRAYPEAVRAAGAVLYYAQHNLRRKADHIRRLQPYALTSFMLIDRASQRNLELVDSLFSDQRNATLLSVLDRTVTPMGSRLMRDRILRPLRDRCEIIQRLDAVAAFVGDPILLSEFREVLGAVKDLERTITRLNVGSANARDLVVLHAALTATPDLKSILGFTTSSDLLGRLCADLETMPEIVDQIERAIVASPPLTIRDGGIINSGYHPHLDDLRQAATEGRHWIADFQRSEIERTSIKSLKVRYNKVFGYYVEISKSYLDQIPENYVRKQTLVNAERFITPELKAIEDKIIGAEDKAKALEYELFQEVRAGVIANTALFQKTAHAIAQLDCTSALADTALTHNYCRPEIVDEPTLEIQAGRHPVIDHLDQDYAFVPNDTVMNVTTDRLLVITGPNMAGKSTYIRQVALLVIMAQTGSYIPAESATIGLVDRVFTRIGAADDLSRGQSTFMVEMLETANILNNATSRSLIVLDEVGRGTSTFDGLSIAWAVAEFIHDNPALQARTLFATHYHELTELASTKSGVRNYNVAVSEDGDDIRFLRKILPGPADKSYGIHVARLAGLPQDVLLRATEILANLEGNAYDDDDRKPKLARSNRRQRRQRDQPTLFDM